MTALDQAASRVSAAVGPVPRARFGVTGWGASAPADVVTNADLERRLDTSDEWIVARSGIRERRLARPGETTRALATRAALAALERAGRRPEDVGLVVVATSTPEQPMPPTAALVADDLRAAGSEIAAAAQSTAGPGVMDVNGACAGFPYALASVGGLLHTGAVTNALVIGAETMTRITDPDDRATAVLFGDGAGALVLEALLPDGGSGDTAGRRSTPADVPAGDVGGGPLSPAADDGEAPGLLGLDLASDLEAAKILEVPAGGAARPPSEATIAERGHFMRMDGKEVFRRAVRAVAASVERVLGSAEISADQVDLFVPHQANARIVEAVAKRTGLRLDHTAGNIERFGNTSAASIPMVLCEAAEDGRIDDGDVVLLTGFGAGLTVGTALVRWGGRR